MCTSRMIARSATVPYLPTMRSWPAMCTFADWVILGGFTGVHQFCRIGAHTMTAAGTVVVQDIPPFVMAAGNTASPYGINAEG
jgi:acyl-[acyl carrier protein]--UDP-N-acetylglucosamine O-acyltransferase